MFLRFFVMICAVASALVALLIRTQVYAGDRVTDMQVAADAPSFPPAPIVGPVRRGANGQLETFDPTRQEGTGKRLCSLGTICVGGGQAYPTLTSALAVAREGDIIEIVATTYHETAKIAVPKVILRGVAGRPHFDCAGM